jgi:CRISPR-associated protein Csy1
MLDETIVTFLSERKATKLKGVSDFEQIQKIEETFHPENWLSDTAKKAKDLAATSHPPKFSHPDIKKKTITSTCAVAESKNDGFLRTGNVANTLSDIFGNAATQGAVYDLLFLKLSDGKTVLTHLEENTDFIQQQLKLASTPFDELRYNFLAIKQDKSSKIRTSGQVKQVYFPVENDYHLLSVLTPSGLMFALKEKIQSLRFSEETKSAREAERNNVFHEKGFDELYDLTVIGFGGTKPQNISVLNNKYHGEAYLLPSIPPSFKIRNFQIPATDFFKNSIYPNLYKDSFEAFHRLVIAKHNNINIRDGRDNIIEFVIDEIIERSWQIRQLDAGWSEKTNLPMYQKIWLDNAFLEERENSDDWLNRVIKELSHWFFDSYKKVVKDAEFLGDEDLRHIRTLIEENQDGLL